MKFIIIASIFFCLSGQAVAQQPATLSSRIQAMAKEKDPAKNVTAMHDIIKTYKLDTNNHAEDLDLMNGIIALSYLNDDALSKFEYHISLIRNKFNQTSYLNMAADQLIRQGKNQSYAEMIAKKTVTLYDSYKNDPLAKPNNFAVDDWNRFMRMAAYPYYSTYATLLHTKGNFKDAFFYLEQALKDQELEQVDGVTIALYTDLLLSQQQTDKAYAILLKMSSLGKSTAAMDTQLKSLYIKNGGTAANATLLLDSLQKNVRKAYITELTNKMIKNTAAPNFSLSNLNGKPVSLTSLKGKVVVLDFWATWCAPCIAAMPAMKEVSERHPEVVFLFVATQEKGADANTRVKTYVKTHQFPINVVMDDKNFAVAQAYKVTGIPSKMVIDKEGNLLFTSTGYTSHKELVTELEAMISIAKAQ